MSLVNEKDIVVKIYDHEGLYYYTKTRKPCRSQDKPKIDFYLSIGKYVIEYPEDRTPIPNQKRFVKMEEKGIPNKNLIQFAEEEKLKISNKVCIKLKEIYKDYDEEKFRILFRSWSHIFSSVSFSQKKDGELAFHRKQK